MKSFICPVVSAIIFGTRFRESVASEVNVVPLNEVSRVEADEKRTLKSIKRISYSQKTIKYAKAYYSPADSESTYYPSKSAKGSKTYAPTATAYPKKSKGSKTYAPTGTIAPTTTAYPKKSKGSKTYAPTYTKYSKQRL
eukprot:CAMPEP_0194299710 /NCGR_PEP_ID=MMETSP0169-20130528/60859_1 /TAXON_ID=218684 /ORGANISM="Corethron pennatum, Strain L29A3" /LENGTH=138 /DNA_ID=CAMNT_0039049819 /DNA_START=531 /DNA_END=947 /DNA_ORIENTATION=-